MFERYGNEVTPLLGQRQPYPTRRYVLLLCICNFSMAGIGAFFNVPHTRLIEDNLCRRYIDTIHQDAVDEKFCKTDQIQSKLAYLNSSIALIEALISLVAAFPFGVLADIIGRKSIIFLSTLGGTLSLALRLAIISLPGLLPVEYILLTPLLTIIGGGSTVLVANEYSILSDIVPETERTSAFFMMGFAALFGSTVGPAISSRMMESFSPWVPMLIGLVGTPLSVVMFVFVPETLAKREPVSNETNVGLEEIPPNTFKRHVYQSWKLLKTSLRMLRSSYIIFVLATYLTAIPETLAASQLFPQYISKRFGMSLSKAGYLLTLRGIVQMALLLVVLPVLSKLLLRWLRPATKDIILARVSGILLIGGAFLMGTSQMGVVLFGLVLQTMGTGLASLCRSLATSHVSSRDAAKLNTLIGIVETIGSLIAVPTLAWLFATGMRLNEPWLGLPYLGLSAWFVLCLSGLFFVNPSISIVTS